MSTIKKQEGIFEFPSSYPHGSIEQESLVMEKTLQNATQYSDLIAW